MIKTKDYLSFLVEIKHKIRNAQYEAWSMTRFNIEYNKNEFLQPLVGELSRAGSINLKISSQLPASDIIAEKIKSIIK